MAREIDKEKIEKQAKEIIDKFAHALEKIEKEHEIESYVERENFERTEGNGKAGAEDFKKNMLKNAPLHDDDFIIAERGGWK